MARDDGRQLDVLLQDPTLYKEPAACLPKEAPGVGAAQEWLEIRWPGRTRVFETFATPPGLNGEVIKILGRASQGLSETTAAP